MATRPSTPYYFYSDAASTASSSNGDPPPSYTSSDSDPSSSLSSPRSSSSNSGGQQLFQPLSNSQTFAAAIPSASVPARRHGSNTVVDMGPLHMTALTGSGSASTSTTGVSGVSSRRHDAISFPPSSRNIQSCSSSHHPTPSTSSSNGNNALLSASLLGSASSGYGGGSSSNSNADADTLSDDFSSSEYSHPEIGESSSRSLRFGGLPLEGASAAGFGSTLSSRAASPAMGGHSSSAVTSVGPNGPTSPSGSSSSAASSAVHHHIHHHYHHGAGGGSSSSGAASTSTGSATLVGAAPVASNLIRSLSNSSASTSKSVATNATGKSGKERRTLISSADYDVPDDGYFFAANNGYHYRNGPLARKLGSTILSRDPSLTDLPLLASSTAGSPNPASAYSTASRRRAGWKSPRRSGNVALLDGGSFLGSDDFTIANTNANGGGFNNPLLDGSAIRNRRRFSAFVPISIQKWWYRFLRHPLVPTQPLTILFSVALFAAFAFSVTTFMYHVLSTDKAPRPWRQYCQEQRPFPHELADSLAPVDVFVGVFSVDAAYERRHLIRSTYLRHTRPIDPHTGKTAQNVQMKFILGRPRKHHARRIALEMETYNDIVVLDMKENMNQGKTHAFFKWANENATIPFYYKPPSNSKRIGKLTPDNRFNNDGQQVEAYNLGFKKADYVVKADDDSFLVLNELERHLRVAPRTNMYWGYLIRNLFMGGECYALSADLVNYVATYPALEAYTTGAEDKRVAKWMRLHPNASSINWITERCYIYDHPKAATTYSHGFLFPDEVERVRAEGVTGISVAEKQRRGGELSDAWSSVSKWKKGYIKPKKDLTIEEEVEALVEGGGRWTALDGWTNKVSAKDVLQWDRMVFDSSDERIQGGADKTSKAEAARSQYNLRTETAFGKYNRIPNSLLRDPGELDIRPQHAKRSWEFWKRDGQDDPGATLSQAGVSSLRSFAANDSLSSSSSESAAPSYKETASDPYERLQPDAGAQYPIGSSPNFKKGFSFLPDPPANPDILKHRAIPAPTLRYDPDTMTLRERRFLGLSYGGTVVVHYLKRNEWFIETALALLGREKFWDTGLDPPAYQPYVPPPPAGDRLPPYNEGKTGDATNKKEKKVATIPIWNAKTGGEIELIPAEWGSARMYGSPLVRENGYIALGRTVPWDALQKSEEGKYGKLRGSPRQRFAEPLGDKEGKDHDDEERTSEPSSPSTSDITGSSSSSILEERSSSEVSSSSKDSDLHSHSASLPPSSLESQAQDTSTTHHTHAFDTKDGETDATTSSKAGNFGVKS